MKTTFRVVLVGLVVCWFGCKNKTPEVSEDLSVALRLEQAIENKNILFMSSEDPPGPIPQTDKVVVAECWGAYRSIREGRPYFFLIKFPESNEPYILSNVGYDFAKKSMWSYCEYLVYQRKDDEAYEEYKESKSAALKSSCLSKMISNGEKAGDAKMWGMAFLYRAKNGDE